MILMDEEEICISIIVKKTLIKKFDQLLEDVCYWYIDLIRSTKDGHSTKRVSFELPDSKLDCVQCNVWVEQVAEFSSVVTNVGGGKNVVAIIQCCRVRPGKSQNICSLRTISAKLCRRRGGPNVCSLQQEDYCLDRWMDHDQGTCPICRTPVFRRDQTPSPWSITAVGGGGDERLVTGATDHHSPHSPLFLKDILPARGYFAAGYDLPWRRRKSSSRRGRERRSLMLTNGPLFFIFLGFNFSEEVRRHVAMSAPRRPRADVLRSAHF
ncbi:hypothetical protein LXL04_023286 [Taraxacum kok-saghyz]